MFVLTVAVVLFIVCLLLVFDLMLLLCVFGCVFDGFSWLGALFCLFEYVVSWGCLGY